MTSESSGITHRSCKLHMIISSFNTRDAFFLRKSSILYWILKNILFHQWEIMKHQKCSFLQDKFLVKISKIFSLRLMSTHPILSYPFVYTVTQYLRKHCLFRTFVRQTVEDFLDDCNIQFLSNLISSMWSSWQISIEDLADDSQLEVHELLRSDWENINWSINHLTLRKSYNYWK